MHKMQIFLSDKGSECLMNSSFQNTYLLMTNLGQDTSKIYTTYTVMLNRHFCGIGICRFHGSIFSRTRNKFMNVINRS